MDLYLFNTIINMIWYMFTILFLLYKFTSFFSYMYNFVRFCGKIWKGVGWIKEQMSPNTLPPQSPHTSHTSPPTFIEKVKAHCTNWYNKARGFFGYSAIHTDEYERELFTYNNYTTKPQHYNTTTQHYYNTTQYNNNTTQYNNNTTPQHHNTTNQQYYVPPTIEESTNTTDHQLSNQFHSVYLEPVNQSLDPLLHSSIFNPILDKYKPQSHPPNTSTSKQMPAGFEIDIDTLPFMK